MKKVGAILFLAGLATAAGAQTNAPAARALSLQDCIAEALRHNFDVRVERLAPVIAQLGLDAAYTPYDPVLSVSGTHSYDMAGGEFANGLEIPAETTDANEFSAALNGSLPSGATYGLGSINGPVLGQSYGSANGTPFENASGALGARVDQPLLKNLWIDSTRLKISAAKSAVKFTYQGLRNQLITTVSAVENAYYELTYARENLEVDQEALDLAQTQLDEDRQRVQIGTVAERAGTLEQDQAQVAQNRANLIAAQFTLEQDGNALKGLITDDYLKWHDQDIAPTEKLEAVKELFDLQDSWSKGMAGRPDLLQAELTLKQDGIQLKFDKNQLFPQLDLIASYGFNGAGAQYDQVLGQYSQANRPFYTYGGQLSLPLDNLAARSSYKSDKAMQQQDLLKVKQLEQNVMVQIDNAVKQAQSAWESVDATKEARIYAEAALDAEQKKYAVGKSTTFTVLQLQNNLTSARSQEIRSLANYQEALTNLAQQEGATLERRQVDVAGK